MTKVVGQEDFVDSGSLVFSVRRVVATYVSSSVGPSNFQR